MLQTDGCLVLHSSQLTGCLDTNYIPYTKLKVEREGEERRRSEGERETRGGGRESREGE